MLRILLLQRVLVHDQTVVPILFDTVASLWISRWPSYLDGSGEVCDILDESSIRLIAVLVVQREDVLLSFSDIFFDYFLQQVSLNDFSDLEGINQVAYIY